MCILLLFAANMSKLNKVTVIRECKINTNDNEAPLISENMLKRVKYLNIVTGEAVL